MINPQDIYNFISNSINNNIREARKYQLASICNPSFTAAIRKLSQSPATFIDGTRHASGCAGIILLNVFDNAEEILRGRRGPSQAHLGTQYLLQFGAYFLMFNEFPTLRRRQTQIHRFNETSVIFQVRTENSLHKFTNFQAPLRSDFS